VFGGTRIVDYLGRVDLPHERIGETWEVRDVEGDNARIVEGSLAGRSFRSLPWSMGTS
jgi:mannose-6-phosphate isomerase